MRTSDSPSDSARAAISWASATRASRDTARASNQTAVRRAHLLPASTPLNAERKFEISELAALRRFMSARAGRSAARA